MELSKENTSNILQNKSYIYQGNSTEDELCLEEIERANINFYTSIMKNISAVFCFLTFIVAVVSWIKIPRWRTFQNFLYFKIIICCNMTYLVLPLIKNLTKLFVTDINSFNMYWRYPKVFFQDAFVCWLFIISVYTYMQIVKVFSVDVTRKRVKSAYFAWGVTLLNSLFRLCYIGTESNFWMVFPVLIVFFLIVCNLIIYVRLIYSLFYEITYEYKQKRQVATLTFLISGFMMLPTMIFDVCTLLNGENKSFKTSAALKYIYNAQKIMLNLIFLLLKSNRAMWREFFCKTNDHVEFP